MKLHVATLHQISEMETTLVGVFSSREKALGAGKDAIREFTGKEPVMLDWDYENSELRFYYEGFTLMNTEVTLNQPI